MIQAPRLDNLTSCQSCLYGLTASESAAETVNMIALFDHEECGSRSKQGAGSTILVTLMEKILLCSGHSSRMEFLNSMLNSFLVSLDVAHASHPNHPEKADPTNPIRLDGGVIIKMNTNQRYATDTSAVAVVEAICRNHSILHQKFVNHGDIAGGGTLGSILSATIPAKTVDIGVPLLGMHSSKELMAASSQLAMNQFVKAFFSEME
jgi:aspartyl aminopeptidase